MEFSERLMLSWTAQSSRGVKDEVVWDAGWSDVPPKERPSIRAWNRGVMNAPRDDKALLALIDTEVRGLSPLEQTGKARKILQEHGVDIETGERRDAPGPTTAPRLYQRLALLGEVADKNAISVNYRAIALTPKHARAAAPFGIMRTTLDLGLADDAAVDAADFLAVLRSAPPAPFAAELRDQALHWRCGPASGHLSLIAAEVPEPIYDGELTSLVGDEFGSGLALGALAAGSSPTARAAGFDGVQLTNRNGYAYALASDNIVISSCRLGDRLPLPEGETIVTLRPQAAALLGELAQRDDEVFIGIDRTVVYVLTEHSELQLNRLAPLPVDIAEKLAPYHREQQAMPLLHETVSAFLKRAADLAEVRQQAMVEIAVEDGRTRLMFREITGSTEEYYEIVKGGPKFTAAAVRVEARRLAQALGHADRMVFDYVGEHRLFLRGPDEFIFGISGRQ